jgi:DNA repair exonuclease SbcCD ATPase subunit
VRVDKLILRNMIGIWDAMGRTELELDFTKDSKGNPLKKRNRIVMMVGKNGSGKSTIMSFITPFAETTDDRASIVLPDAEGYKEIHYTKGEDVYVIKHYYKKPHKSYMEKNGEELNPNGGVRTFESTVKDEFGIDKDFFRIGKIGSNVASFIDYKTSERKKYISKFLPDIDDYLRYYKIVSNKFTSLNRQIKVVSDQIDKIDKRENLEILKESLEGQIALKEEQIDRSKGIVNKFLGRSEQMDPSGEYSEGNPHKALYKKSQQDMERSERKLDEYYEEYPQLSAYDIEKTRSVRQKAQSSLDKSEREIERINEDITAKNSTLVGLYNELERKQNILEEVEAGESLQDLIEMKDKKTSLIKKLKDKVEENSKFEKYNSITYSTLISIRKSMSTIRETLLNVKRNFSEEMISEALESTPKEIETKIASRRRALKSLDLAINEKNMEIKSLDGNRSKLDILKLRPDDCFIDSCSFIKDALQYKDLDDDILKIEEEINREEEKKSAIEREIEELQEKYEMFTLTKNAFSLVDNSFAGLPNSENFSSYRKYNECLLLSQNEIQRIFDLDDFTEYVKSNEDLIVEAEKLRDLKEKISLIQNQSKMVENTKFEVNGIKERISEIKSEVEKAKGEISEISKKISREKLRIGILDNLEELISTRDASKKTLQEIQGEYTRVEKIIEDLLDIKVQIESERKNLKVLQSELDPMTKKLRETEIKISNLDSFEERKRLLEESFEDVKLIKESLDPTKGIPLHFIGGYLEETSLIANKLLDLAYNRKFRIKFKVTETDFFIRVMTESGGIKEDILDASQGETALTAISISWAMIQQMIETYNIIGLDEADATLDSDNRINFLNMIDIQMDELEVEQLFIISHNNELDAYPTDLILLNNHSVNVDDEKFMENKNVIFNIKEESA